MIASLKKTEFGRMLHRLKLEPILAGPLELLSQAVQVELIQISHLYPKHLSHNSRQSQILNSFANKQK